ncbi:hypothetical protein [Pseudonocardia sp. ICBG601]|uniref:hypothetical protein n=1 Tax=Pseudonocardia sp. ICBG601 TaxID=2846759 RepID=UPI001CF64016|nr:hypothetical protein [Pseudonocardia sp. ICBG601]
MRTALRAATTAAGAVAAALALAAVTAGTASAQPAPTTEPPLTPADQAAQLVCLQKYLDFGALPAQSLADPVAFSALVTKAAQECDAVRAPATPAAPTAPVAGA